METGKVPESVLKRSVFKTISYKRPEVVLGAGVGEDCTVLQLEPDEQLVMSTDPITGTTQDMGRLAIQITVNDLASAGAEPIGVMLTVLLPENAREIRLKEIMSQASEAASTMRVEIMGGHTEVTAAVNQPVISVTGVGKVKKGCLISTGGARPGMDIVLTKWIGLEGTSIIAKEKRTELLKKLPEAIVDEAAAFDRYISVVDDGMTAVKAGVAAMHDVTEGGIFGALWEMAEASGVGLEIDLRAIPIRQETVEVCEQFGLNPYQLISSGSMLMAAADGEKLVRVLEEQGIPASLIGKATDTNDRVLINNGERRFLEPPKTDELYRIYS